MAASPIAAFPVIRTLATIHLFGYFGADQCTNSAAGTFAIIVEDGRQIAAGIQFIGGRYQFLGAERDTEFTALAQLLRNFDRSFHVSHVYGREQIFARLIVFTKGFNYKFWRLDSERAPENPSQSPFTKGEVYCFPLWKRGIKGDLRWSIYYQMPSFYHAKPGQGTE